MQNVYLLRFMPVCVRLIMLAAYFCHHKRSIIVQCSLIEVDWLDACIALRGVGAVLVVFLRQWHKICAILQKMESPKPSRPMRSKETWTVYTPLTLFGPRTDHACHQKPNPSRETVPLRGEIVLPL